MKHIKEYQIFESVIDDSNLEGWISVNPDKNIEFPSLEEFEKLPWFLKFKEMFPKLKDVSTERIRKNGNIYLDIGLSKLSKPLFYKLYSSKGAGIRSDQSHADVDLNRPMKTLSDWNEFFMRLYLILRKRQSNSPFSSKKIKDVLSLIYDGNYSEIDKLNQEEIQSIPKFYIDEVLKGKLIKGFKEDPIKTLFKIKDSNILYDIYNREIKGKIEIPKDKQEDLDLVTDLKDVGL